MKIIVIGSINRDITLEVDEFVREGETISALHQSSHLGGKGFNQAVAISKVFPNIHFYCNINEKDIHIINTVKSQPFHTSSIQLVPQETGSAFIQTNKSGENCIIISKNANNTINLNTVRQFLSSFSKGDFIVLQNEINDINAIIDLAKKQKLFIIFNPSPFTNDITSTLLKKIDMLILNQRECNAITKKDTLQESLSTLTQKYPEKEILITLGNNGVMYAHQNTIIKIAAPQVVPVDTTCAGDTFLGYFIGLYANKVPIKESLHYATKAASLAIQQKGASTSIPEATKVLLKWPLIKA